MSTGRHIRAIGDETEGADTGANPVDDGMAEGAQDGGHVPEYAPSSYDELYHEPVESRQPWPTVLRIGAVLLVLAWTAFFLWSIRTPLLSGATPMVWTGWIAQWAAPVLLVTMAWLIAVRSSARESARFGAAARVLAQESALLESRLVTVNRELSLAREFLAAQSRELDYLGRSAAERIAEHAGKLQSLVVDNGAQVDAIAGVSQTALANMTELRDNLPVIANSARDVSNQIGGAGRSAKAQLGELVAGFERLNDFGQASERQVASLRARIDTTLEDLSAFVDTLDANNAARFAALRGESESLRGDLESRESEVLAAMRARGDALRAELVAAHDARQLEEAAALAAMRGRISSFTREAHDAAAAVRAGERAALESWEGQVAGLRDRLKAALEEVGALDQQFLEKARSKLAELTGEAEAVDQRLGERDRGFAERVASRQLAFEQAEAAALARMRERFETLDSELTARHEAQGTHADTIAQKGETLAARIAEIEAHLASIAARSALAERSLTNSSEHFATAVSATGAQLSETESALDRLTDASVRLLELIQAAASHSRSVLPASIAGFEDQLDAAKDSSGAIRAALEDARRLGDEVRGVLVEMHGAGAAAIGDLDAYRSRLTGTAEEQSAALGTLREQIVAANEQNRALAESISGDLAAAVGRIGETAGANLASLRADQETALEDLQARLTRLGEVHAEGTDRTVAALLEAIEKLKAASTAIFDDLDTGQNARVHALAERIGEESAGAIDRAITARTADAVTKLDEATAKSAEVSRETVANLRDQLARVHELTVNLESRAARAREQVEEQVDNDFSRRMALITESLNSNSIDIAKALSTEVTDTAWASYLKGDRGIFTRRAVKLIENGQAREIAALYEGDHEFRDHVSRYIHDFEAMLRTMLSTRDGHVLGVTLLSSDMGKLYVALAQSIQRLRQ